MPLTLHSWPGSPPTGQPLSFTHTLFKCLLVAKRCHVQCRCREPGFCLPACKSGGWAPEPWAHRALQKAVRVAI